MKQLLAITEHRAYPYPGSPWVMTQSWNDLLFAHWPFQPDTVRALIPTQMELETFDGAAWIAVVPFKMRNVRPRMTPLVPILSDFLELNVRTYVSVNGIPGVYFFSLDANSLLGVEGARLLFHLPYYYAEMQVSECEGVFHYRSERVDKRGLAAGLDVRYAPKSDVIQAKPGSLEHFLTERYCLYTISGDNNLLRAHIHHAPWPLQEAHADFSSNTMLSPIGLAVSGQPLLHYAKSLPTVEWPPEVVPSRF
jgi:uncharacterized protein YqjF (DUF2071 family)